MKNTIWLFLFLTLSFTVFTQTSLPVLVEVEEVSQLTEEDGFVWIDVRPADQYIAGHIDGALNIWRPSISRDNYEYEGMMASKIVIENLFSGLGINSTDHLILYDAKGNVDASRLWWVLKRYGHDKVSLMNGGLTTWESSGHPLSKKEYFKERSNYTFPDKGSESLIATKEDILDALKSQNVVLLDTREKEEYTGGSRKKGASRNGRIPGAIWINYSEAIDYSNDQRLKSSEELKEIYSSRGLSPETPIITYCQSGVRSAHTTFVLTEILGYNNVRNYDGSWIEWSYDAALPLETGESDTPKAVFASSQDKVVAKPNYANIFITATKDFARYTWNEITFKVNPWYINYFWWLVVLSLVVWVLEIVFPWRKNQPIFRKDFWLDNFYMFFNFYIFKIIIFFAFSTIVYTWFSNLVGGVDRLIIYDTKQLNPIVQLIVFFILVDFIQWFTHVLLHRYEFLWKFHKVHHSVEQMGYAAHLRYHWMENVFYTPMKFIVMMIIGNFDPQDAFIVYYISIAIGHLNHANIDLSYGPLKYILNNPRMHIWHHSYDLPPDRQNGVNFGISLSIWDYIFKTAYIPKSGRDIRLGFPKIESFPKSFWGQLVYGFWSGKGSPDNRDGRNG